MNVLVNPIASKKLPPLGSRSGIGTLLLARYGLVNEHTVPSRVVTGSLNCDTDECVRLELGPVKYLLGPRVCSTGGDVSVSVEQEQIKQMRAARVRPS